MEGAGVDGARDIAECDIFGLMIGDELPGALDQRRFGIVLLRGELLGGQRKMAGKDFEQSQHRGVALGAINARAKLTQ
jgi:hypothetical protein